MDQSINYMSRSIEFSSFRLSVHSYVHSSITLIVGSPIKKKRGLFYSYIII